MFRTKKQLFITLFVVLAIALSIGFMVWKIIQISQGGNSTDSPASPSESVSIPSVSGKGSVNKDEAAIAKEKAEKKKKEEEATAKKKAAQRTDSAYTSPGSEGGSYSHDIDTSGLSPCYDTLEQQQEQAIANIDANTRSQYVSLIASLEKDRKKMHESPLPATDDVGYSNEVTRRKSVDEYAKKANPDNPVSVLYYAQSLGRGSDVTTIDDRANSQKNAVYQDYAGRTC